MQILTSSAKQILKRTTIKEPLNNKGTNYYFGTTVWMVLITYSLHTQPIKKSLEICKHKTAFRITLSLKNVQSNPKTNLQDEERIDINENHCENFDKNILAKPK